MKKRKIVYLGINSSYSHSSLAYGFIKAYTHPRLTSSEEWTWQLIEATINDDSLSICEKVYTEQPDIILSTFYLFNHHFLNGVIKRCKALLPDVTIFTGGPEFLGENKHWLEHNQEVAACFRGDESSLYLLLNNINNCHTWSTIPGLCYINEKGHYIDNGTATLPLTESIPSPYIPELFTTKHPFIQLETSRGCKSKCIFCTSSLAPHTRCDDFAAIKDNLQLLIKHGITEIRVLDRTFNESKEKTLQLLNLFINEYPQINFHLEINPALLDEEILALLKQAPIGQFHIEAGVQSLNDEVLKTIKRPGNAAKTLAGIKKLCSLNNIEIHVDLIAGLPQQKLADIFEDLKQLIACSPEEIQLENLKLLPGTSIHTSIDQYSITWNPLPPYEILKTATMSFQDTQTARVLSTIIDSYYNTPKLRSIFTYAVINYPNFLEEFLAFYSSLPEPLMKNSLKKRFLIFEQYILAMGTQELQELFRYTWLASGFSIEKYELKAKKCFHAPESNSPLWQDPQKRPPKRFFQDSFSFNTADLWLNPHSKHIKTQTTYTFFQALGNVMAEIYSTP